MDFYATMESPLGTLILTANAHGLTGLFPPKNSHYATAAEGKIEDATQLAPYITQMQEYFAGTRRVFDVPLAPHGTAFQQRVWHKLCTIPYGQTTHYGGLAREMEMPGGSRAVGTANGRNPICIIIPCHRVIGASGGLGGYNGGLAAKEWLLKHEGALLG